MKFNQKIWTIRASLKWSQSELAEKVGMHHNSISNIENGKTSPRVNELDKIAQALGTTSSILLDGSDRLFP